MTFVPPRDRDAWATIRGFVAQVELTLKRWLELPDGHCLELERGEDIDEVIRRATAVENLRTLEQVKSRKASITLRSPAALEAIANFAEHRAGNTGLSLHFRFTTNATRGREREKLFEGGRRGIDVWDDLRAGRLSTLAAARALTQLRKALLGAKRPKDLSSTFALMPPASPREAWR
jgi:hypothetical protein